MTADRILLMNRSLPAWGLRTILLLSWVLMNVFVSTHVEAAPADRWQQLTDEGTLAREQARYREAEQVFLAAGHEAEQFGSTDTRVATTYNNLGLVLHEQGNYLGAKGYYERALAVWEQTLGPEHAEVATALHNLAEIYQQEGELEQAEAYYLRALAIGERVLGSGHPQLALAHNGLGLLYRKEGHLVQAETRFHLALALLER